MGLSGMVSRLLAGAATCSFLVPAGAAAQQAGVALSSDDSDTSPASATAGQTPGDRLEEIVVTARKTNENLQDVPVAVTAIPEQKLTDLSVRDILEIQKIAPGLYVGSAGSAGRAKFTIRGQSEADSRLTTDGSVGVYVDGVPITRTFGIRSSFVDIAQVEVLKGPQGTLFGKNTTGGALNITTQHPTYEWGGYADLLYGSYNNMQALGVINIPLIDQKLAVRAVVQRITRDGYGTDAAGHDVGDDDVLTGRLHIRADPTDTLHILVSGDYTHQDTHGSNSALSADAMLANANTATKGLGEIAYELGLNPNSAADRLTAYNKWRTYYDSYQNGDIYDSASDLNVFDKLGASIYPMKRSD